MYLAHYLDYKTGYCNIAIDPLNISATNIFYKYFIFFKKDYWMVSILWF